MSNEVIAAVIAALFSLASVFLSVSTKFSLERRTRRESRQTFMEQYRGPLIHAAYNLQSRLARILTDRDCLAVLASDADPRERDYFISNTAFVVGQYMAWAELIRREISHLDLGEVRANRSLSILLDDMYGHWQSDKFGKSLRLFAGEQRAIGDAMLVRGNAPGERHVLGYGEFLERAGQMPFLREFRDELADADRIRGAFGRLKAVQNGLVDMIDLLDPEVVYFQAANRGKV